MENVMPTAKLIGPRRLNIRGRIYIKDEEVDVNSDEAKLLDSDPRFRVKGIFGREEYEADALANRPKGEALIEDIIEKMGMLETPDDTKFDRSGKPSHYALSELLKYPISVAERDRAMQVLNPPDEPNRSPMRPATEGRLDAADGTVTTDNTKPRVFKASGKPEVAVQMK
jgi:hypothetical protein